MAVSPEARENLKRAITETVTSLAEQVGGGEQNMEDAAGADTGDALGRWEGEGGRTAKPRSPAVSPSDVAGKTPDQIDQLARDKGLQPKGPDPRGGRGSYVDPVTGEQRILVHGDHAHVNDPAGNRLDASGNRVPQNSPAAHLPIRRP
jgi:hypothetical protein